MGDSHRSRICKSFPITNAADAEAIYNEVVDVIREFFELEFDVRTSSRTTREFLTEAIEQVQLGEMPRKRLTWLARLADEIKFARRGVGEEQVRQALQQAQTFVAECEAASSDRKRGGRLMFSNPWLLLLLLLVPFVAWRLWSRSRTVAVPFSSTQFRASICGRPGGNGWPGCLPR